MVKDIHVDFAFRIDSDRVDRFVAEWNIDIPEEYHHNSKDVFKLACDPKKLFEFLISDDKVEYGKCPTSAEDLSVEMYMEWIIKQS